LAILLARVLNAPHCLQASTITVGFPPEAFLETFFFGEATAAFFFGAAVFGFGFALVAAAFLGAAFLAGAFLGAAFLAAAVLGLAGGSSAGGAFPEILCERRVATMIFREWEVEYHSGPSNRCVIMGSRVQPFELSAALFLLLSFLMPPVFTMMCSMLSCLLFFDMTTTTAGKAVESTEQKTVQKFPKSSTSTWLQGNPEDSFCNIF
jgi:hypothetical protein